MAPGAFSPGALAWDGTHQLRKCSRTINRLARKIGAPRYSFTSSWEVRKLRSRLIAINPGLITVDPPPPGQGKKGGGISKYLSPIEAFHVTAMMVRQKLVNPEFQLTYEEQVANWRVLNSPHSHADLGNAGRRAEMISLVARAFSNMSFRDLILEGEDSLKTLGIE